MKANTEIANIDTEGAWINITATIHQLWDSTTPSIRQVGLLKDETGIVKFVSWEKSGLPLVEQGVEYTFTNLPVSKYGEYFSVSLNSTTEITRVVNTAQSEVPTV